MESRRPRRVPRTSGRPQANHAARVHTRPLPTLDDVLAYPIESPNLDIDVRPIGGIFGTAEAPALPERKGISRVAGKLRSGRRLIPARPKEASLFLDEGFRLLWTIRLLTQIAQSALLYSLLILIVDISNKSIYNSFFVMCSIVPSLFFSLPAGVVVDTVPRKFLLVLLNIFRFLFMLFLVAAEPSLGGIFAATLGIWMIHQFYSPAEASMLAGIVPQRRYTEAQALFNFALTLSQAIGLVILAPLLLKIGGGRLVFAFAAVLYIMAIAMTILLPKAVEAGNQIRRVRQGLRESLGNGLRFALRDQLTFEAIIDDVLVSVGMSALVVIMPFYLERILDTSKENTVFVFAPAALGLVLGLRFAPKLGATIGERYSATLALVMFSACVAALGFIEPTFAVLNDTINLPVQQLADVLSVSPLILMAMLISIPAGFASSLVNVAARSMLLQRTPPPLRGQVIATQSLVGNVIALFPTLLAGIAMDVLGVKPVAVAIAVTILLIAVFARTYARRQMQNPPLLVGTA